MRRMLWQLMVPMGFVLTVNQSIAQHPAQSSVHQMAVTKLEEAFRLAKVEGDTATLGRIVANNYVGTNQYGETRSKADLIELFKTTSAIKSLTSRPSQIRITGDTAVVTGTQTETKDSGVERMLFMRVYIRNREADEWQLLANMQFVAPD